MPLSNTSMSGIGEQKSNDTRLEREAGRNVEVMWLLGRLAPDHKAIADFRKDNGGAIKKVCARFVELCWRMGFAFDSECCDRWHQSSE
jgi:transposase